MYLDENKIGDGGAIALARKFKGDASDEFSFGARDTVLLASANVISQETFCHLQHRQCWSVLL